MAVFTRLGFHRARMDDIAVEAGLSKGSLYWHFKSKEEIISAVLLRMFQGYLGDLKQVVAMSGPADERLRNYIQRAAQDVANLRRWQPLMAEFYSVATRHASTRLFLKKYYEQYLDLLTLLITQGIEEGVFQPVDPKQTAFLMAATSEGAILLCSLGVCDGDWGEQLETALFQILDSILVGGAGTTTPTN